MIEIDDDNELPNEELQIILKNVTDLSDWAGDKFAAIILSVVMITYKIMIIASNSSSYNVL